MMVHIPETAKFALLSRVTEQITKLLDVQGLSQADLARLTGTTRSHISQLLSGDRNMTLGTLADLLYVMGYEASVDLRPACTLNHDCPAAPGAHYLDCTRRRIDNNDMTKEKANERSR